jgi:hypothetical protein
MLIVVFERRMILQTICRCDRRSRQYARRFRESGSGLAQFSCWFAAAYERHRRLRSSPASGVPEQRLRQTASHRSVDRGPFYVALSQPHPGGAVLVAWNRLPRIVKALGEQRKIGFVLPNKEATAYRHAQGGSSWTSGGNVEIFPHQHRQTSPNNGIHGGSGRRGLR